LVAQKLGNLLHIRTWCVAGGGPVRSKANYAHE
jgi:hypothetical protein